MTNIIRIQLNIPSLNRGLTFCDLFIPWIKKPYSEYYPKTAQNCDEITDLYITCIMPTHTILTLKNLRAFTINDIDLSNIGLNNIVNINQLISLKLINTNLTKFPQEILNSNLLSLSLAYNHIEIIPPEIRTIKNLHQIYLNNNKISKIPDELFLLEISILDLSSNNIKQLPDTIGNLNNIGILQLNGNMLESLPHTINEINKNIDRNLLFIEIDAKQLKNIDTKHITKRILKCMN